MEKNSSVKIENEERKTKAVVTRLISEEQSEPELIDFLTLLDGIDIK